MKIGILGGTFNPIHNGHLAMVEAARTAHRLDRVLLVPSGCPPHKTEDLASSADRLEMTRLAVEGLAGVEVSDIEVARPGVSFTVETLEELQRRFPEAELFFLIGEDSIGELPTWRSPDRILSLARIVAINRPGVRAFFHQDDFPGIAADAIRQLERDRVCMEPSPIESRVIRRAVRAGEPVDAWIPAAVAHHIRERGLYRS